MDTENIPQLNLENSANIKFSILALSYDTCFVISHETTTRTQKQVYISNGVEDLKKIRDFLDKQITSLQP